MVRFSERYGHWIVYGLVWVLGLVLAGWLVIHLAHADQLPTAIGSWVVETQFAVVEITRRAYRALYPHKEMIGALITLLTFLGGLLKAIGLARKFFPRRLANFMREQMYPVYEVPDAILSAANFSDARGPRNEPMYYKAPLDRALGALGHPWRPKMRDSLDESLAEIDGHLEVTRTRLKCLEEMRSNVLLLRAATKTYLPSLERCTHEVADGVLEPAEKDLTDSMSRSAGATIATDPVVRLVSLEMRGILRSARGDLDHATKDFKTLVAQATELGEPLRISRANRLFAETKVRLYSRTRTALRLQEAAELLVRSYDLAGSVEDVKKRESECGLNRYIYGDVRKLQHYHNGNAPLGPAINSYKIAIEHLISAGASVYAHQIERIRLQLRELEGDTSA